MDPEQRLALLQATRLGRHILAKEDAEFARTSDLSDWTPGEYKRDGKVHKKGDPCIRKGDQVRPMPDGYVAHEGRLLHHEDVPEVVAQPFIKGKGNADHLSAILKWDEADTTRVLATLSATDISDRKARLFVAELGRMVHDHLPDTYKAAVRAGLRWADGDRELPERERSNHQRLHDHQQNWEDNEQTNRPAAGAVAVTAISPDLSFRNRHWTGNVEHAAVNARAAIEELRPPFMPDIATKYTKLKQIDTEIADKLRSLVGDPFRIHRIPLNRDIRRLAAGIYERNDPRELPVLADALEDAGADDYTLQSLRHPNAAVRGHWVLDAILGKRDHR